MPKTSSSQRAHAPLFSPHKVESSLFNKASHVVKNIFQNIMQNPLESFTTVGLLVMCCTSIDNQSPLLIASVAVASIAQSALPHIKAITKTKTSNTKKALACITVTALFSAPFLIGMTAIPKLSERGPSKPISCTPGSYEFKVFSMFEECLEKYSVSTCKAILDDEFIFRIKVEYQSSRDVLSVLGRQDDKVHLFRQWGQNFTQIEIPDLYNTKQISVTYPPNHLHYPEFPQKGSGQVTLWLYHTIFPEMTCMSQKMIYPNTLGLDPFCFLSGLRGKNKVVWLQCGNFEYPYQAMIIQKRISNFFSPLRNDEEFFMRIKEPCKTGLLPEKYCFPQESDALDEMSLALLIRNAKRKK